MNQIINYIIGIAFIFMFSCVEPYNPNISKYENVFVVDGEISNLPGPYVVKLSRSYKFEERTGAAVTGAQLKITDNTGLEVELKETSDGVYSTIDPNFQGVIGNSYKLQIVLNNEVYESDLETLKKPVSIDKVYWEYKNKDKATRGVQLFVDSHDSTNSTHYYAWEFDETWKFKVPIDVIGKPEWKECYKYTSSTNFNIASSTQRKGDIIERQPLLFIGENTNRIYIRYSMLAKQYSLTEQAYKFFNDLITLNQNQGTLFDPIPYSLVGNIKNLSNKDMPVLGYFLVAGVSEKRIFIDRKELPKEYSPTDGFDDCNTKLAFVDPDIPNFRDDQIVDSLMKLGYTVYEDFLTTISLGDTVLQLSMAKPPCYNCTLNGKNEVPDFWTEWENK